MFDFLNLKSIAFGLDISDFSLKLIKLKRRAKEFDLASFGEVAIPEGVIEAGEIKNEASLVKIIKQAISETKGEKLKTNEVVCSLPEEKSFLRVMQLPKMGPEELEKAISFEAENHIPIPLQEAYFGYEVVEPLIDHLDHYDILVAAAPRKMIDSYARVLRAAGLIPVVFETESLSTSRALVKNWLTVNPLLLVDFGATKTTLMIFSGRSLKFITILHVSSMRLTQALVSGLGVTTEEAEKIKVNYGLGNKTKVQITGKAAGNGFGKEISEDQKVYQILSSALSEMVSEIKNLLDFYYSHANHEHLPPTRLEVKKVLLSGGGSNLIGLDKFLSKELGISVLLGNPWVNILSEPYTRVPENYLRKSLAYTNALGLALRGIVSEA
ncbi:MAG: type IV pilus assembly protein PilM [bacterium]|nr:type IV pilus assembly protein PilM [bacterium]